MLPVLNSQAVKDKSVVFAQAMQAAMVLTGAGHLAAIQEEAIVLPKRKSKLTS